VPPVDKLLVTLLRKNPIVSYYGLDF